MLLLDHKNYFPDSFFPNHDIKRFDYVHRYTYSELESLVRSAPFIVIAGTTTYVGGYLCDSYPNYERIESLEYSIYDYALNLEKPVIGINRGMDLIAIKAGFEFSDVSEQDIHLVNYKERVYGVNSLHKVTPKLYQHSYYNYPCKDINTDKIEAIYYSRRKSLGIKWNPELDSCPQSGIDLFDLLLKQYTGITR